MLYWRPPHLLAASPRRNAPTRFLRTLPTFGLLPLATWAVARRTNGGVTPVILSRRSTEGGGAPTSIDRCVVSHQGCHGGLEHDSGLGGWAND
jgi:hypothetical protein